MSFGFGHGDSAKVNLVGLGQSDPGKAHSDSAMFDSTIPLVLGHDDSARPLGFSQVHSAMPLGFGQVHSAMPFGFGHGDSAKVNLVGLGQNDSAAHSDSARMFRPASPTRPG